MTDKFSGSGSAQNLKFLIMEMPAFHPKRFLYRHRLHVHIITTQLSFQFPLRFYLSFDEQFL